VWERSFITGLVLARERLGENILNEATNKKIFKVIYNELRYLRRT